MSGLLYSNQPEVIESVKLSDVDTLVLATSGRNNHYTLNEVVGQYKTIIIQDIGYLSSIDLSEFNRNQVVAQHEKDKLKLVIDGGTLVMIDNALVSSKNKLALKFAEDRQPIRLLTILNKLDAYCINGVSKLSDILN